MSVSEKIVLGSGKVFYQEFTGEIPENSEIEKDENRLAHISGGATLEYKPTYYTCKDDLGVVTKTVLTEEEASLKSGIMTFDGEKLKVLCNTARITEEGNIRTVKIGGLANKDGKKYLIHFLHEDKQDGDIRITIVGVNQAGFSMVFQKDKETVIDAEFKCESMDDEGTLIIYQEDISVSTSDTSGSDTSGSDTSGSDTSGSDTDI